MSKIKKIKIVEIEYEDSYPYPDWPLIPQPYTPWQPQAKSQCSECGLVLEGIMGYVCGHPKCPTGLGGPMCYHSSTIESRTY